MKPRLKTGIALSLLAAFATCQLGWRYTPW